MSGKLLTVPGRMRATTPVHVTGNEYLVMAEISPGGEVMGVGLVHMGSRALLEFRGAGAEPFLKPEVIAGGSRVDFSTASCELAGMWVPKFSASQGSLGVTFTPFAPPGFKGAVFVLVVANGGPRDCDVQMGVAGNWSVLRRVLFSREEIGCVRRLTGHDWTGGLVFEPQAGIPLPALAVMASEEVEVSVDRETLTYRLLRRVRLAAGEEREIAFYLGANLERDGASLCAVDLKRRGWRGLLEGTLAWIERRSPAVKDPAFRALVTRNWLFSRFFSAARAIDGEEWVMITSRSPRYYVCGAFWARDSLLWTMPAMAAADAILARELLVTAFTRHLRNAGIHAHYIDGAVLYPGFELDQACAHILALGTYIDATGDVAFLAELPVSRALREFAALVAPQRHPSAALYATFLDPSDDPVTYPYVTYDNALVWKAFVLGARLLELLGDGPGAARYRALAADVREAIMDNCVVGGPFGPMFAWSVDLAGRHELYDSPPGSLQLLAYYGFCHHQEEVFRNTVNWVRSAHNKYSHTGCLFPGAGCEHAPDPWPMSACNLLLAGWPEEGLSFLRRAPMDGGLACESVDRDTGIVATGAAFASFAGFLAHAVCKGTGLA